MADSKKAYYLQRMTDVINQMFKTRPRGEVKYRPYSYPNHSLKFKGWDSTVNLSKIFDRYYLHDYCYVTTSILAPHDSDAALLLRGVYEYRLNGGEWVTVAKHHDLSYEKVHHTIQLKGGYNELVLKCFPRDDGSFQASYNVSCSHFPGMWGNDYIVWFRDTVPCDEYLDEQGYSVSELVPAGVEKAYEDCKTVYPLPSASDAKIDFAPLYSEECGEWALAYTTAKCDTALKLKSDCTLTVYVNGEKSEIGTQVKCGDKIAVLCKRHGNTWGFESEINDCVWPSEITSHRNDGTHWLLLGSFASDAMPEIDFKTPYVNACGKQTYWRFNDKDTFLRPYLDTCFFGQWFYALMVGEYGLLKASKYNSEYYDFFIDHMSILAEYYDYIQYDATLFYDTPFLRRSVKIMDLDSIGTIGMNLCDFCLVTKDEKVRAKAFHVAEELAKLALTIIPRLEDGTLYRTHTNPHTLWADDTFMSTPFLVRMGNLTGDTKYYDEVIKQLKLYTEKLFLEKDNVFAHIYYPHLKRNNSVPWGRGNGWVYLSFAEVIEHLPEGYPGRDDLIEIFKKAVGGLLKLQGERGRWHQVLNIPESYEETSCTAIFSVAMHKGVQMGLLDKDVILPVVNRAVDGMLADGLDEECNVLGVCKGSSCQDGPEYYLTLQTVCNDDHGTGIFVAAICALLDMLD